MADGDEEDAVSAREEEDEEAERERERGAGQTEQRPGPGASPTRRRLCGGAAKLPSLAHESSQCVCIYIYLYTRVSSGRVHDPSMPGRAVRSRCPRHVIPWQSTEDADAPPSPSGVGWARRTTRPARRCSGQPPCGVPAPPRPAYGTGTAPGWTTTPRSRPPPCPSTGLLLLRGVGGVGNQRQGNRATGAFPSRAARSPGAKTRRRRFRGHGLETGMGGVANRVGWGWGILLSLNVCVSVYV